MPGRASLPVAFLAALALLSGPGSAALAGTPAARANRERASAAQPGVSPVPVPAAGRPVNTSHPNHVIGHGTAVSCTSAAVLAAVKAGGIITFSCGAAPITIKLTATAKVLNTSSRVVIDGGGRVTLSGQGARRILYMDTCDPAQVWTTSHCQDQATPSLVVQNLTLSGGNSTGQRYDGGGGGAIFARGGRVRIVDDVFTGNRCESDGPDIGGAAIRALSQYHNLPVYVVASRFSDNVCSNGAGLSSIGVSWTVLNSRFSDNRAIGTGANPARSGTPGGGSGAAIYNDGDEMTLTIGGCWFTDNHANEGGGAIFFVSDNLTGTMSIRHSTLAENPNHGFSTAGLPGIFFLGAHPPTIASSILR